LREKRGASKCGQRQDKEQLRYFRECGDDEFHFQFFLVPFPCACRSCLSFCLSQEFVVDAEQKIGGLFFRANVAGVHAAVLLGRKYGLFQ